MGIERNQDRLRRNMCMLDTYNAASILFTECCTDYSQSTGTVRLFRHDNKPQARPTMPLASVQYSYNTHSSLDAVCSKRGVTITLIDISNFGSNFMQISYLRPFCISNFMANFIEILLIWCSYDVFQLVKFLKIEKRTRSMRLVYIYIQKSSIYT